MLTIKQEKFCAEYVKGGNGTQAYMKAFGTTNNGSARAQASKLLRNPEIQARIQQLQADVADESICAAQEIQGRLSAIARREATEEIFLPNGERVQRQASIRDSVRALELLCRINQMFVVKQEIDLQGTLPVIIKDDL